MHVILAYPGGSAEPTSGVSELALAIARTSEVVIVEPDHIHLDVNAAVPSTLGAGVTKLSVRGQFAPSPTIFESAAQLGQIREWLKHRSETAVWLWLTTPYLLAPFLLLKATYRITRPAHDWREDVTLPVQVRDLALAVARESDLLMPPTRNSDWGSNAWLPLDADLGDRGPTREAAAFSSNPAPVILYKGPVDYRVDFAGLQVLLRNNPGYRLALVGPRGVLSTESKAELARLTDNPNVILVEDCQSSLAASLVDGASAGIVPLALDELDFSQDLANLAGYCRRHGRPGIVTGSEQRLALALSLAYGNLEEIDLPALCSSVPSAVPPRFLDRVSEALAQRTRSAPFEGLLRHSPEILGELRALRGCGDPVELLVDAGLALEAPHFAPHHRRALVFGLRALSRAPRGLAWSMLMARLAEFYFFHNGGQRRGLHYMERVERVTRRTEIGARAYLDILMRHRMMRLGCGDTRNVARLDEEAGKVRSALNISHREGGVGDK